MQALRGAVKVHMPLTASCVQAVRGSGPPVASLQSEIRTQIRLRRKLAGQAGRSDRMKKCPYCAKLKEPHSDLHDQLARSCEASGVPYFVEDELVIQRIVDILQAGDGTRPVAADPAPPSPDAATL